MGDRQFVGTHPWYLDDFDEDALVAALEAHPDWGVGEIGLDRLKTKTISDEMRSVFERQLVIAAYFRRPVVLHGAKCWGQVVEACKPFKGQIPQFLFHGFSRSDGLISDIVALNGYFSIGPAILNDHAENYHALIKKLPPDRILFETDGQGENPALLEEVVKKFNIIRNS